MHDESSENLQATSERLWAVVQHARQGYHKASAQFDDLIADVPSGLPSPDGVFRIEKAAKERRMAFEKYDRALSEFAAFVKSSDTPVSR